MAKDGKTFGSGGPGTMDEQRRQWRKTRRDVSGKTSCEGNGTVIAPASQPVELITQEDGMSRQTASLEGGLTHGTTIHPYDGQEGGDASATGTSIFDPVLCELAYRWFCPPAGRILDPFAGGSVRGIVAAKLGRHYTGIDLRPEQVAANEEQAGRICDTTPPTWIVGDSRDAATLAPGEYDFIFSCPPYADLEVYSDDPRDLSTMDYPAFIAAYRAIIAACVDMLKPDRFACFVVGDVRDKKGFYRRFPDHTVAAFEDAGAKLYNEAVLVTAVGSLPIRVGKQFTSGRKLGKTHQNVFVFVKGDPRKATETVGVIDLSDLAGIEDTGIESNPDRLLSSP